MKKESNWAVGIFLLAFLGVLVLAGREYFLRYPALTSENLDQFIRSFGAWAMLVYLLAYLLASPIPLLAPILAATGGLLFGPWLGAALAISCAAATSLVPFWIARRLGSAWVEAKVKGGRMESIYRQANSGGGFTFILLLRLVPVMPWELQNYIAGVTQVNVWTYLLATVLGSVPLSVALVILGDAARQPGSWQFYGALALTAAVLLAPVLVVLARRRRASKAQM